jgi:hypothetical protein
VRELERDFGKCGSKSRGKSRSRGKSKGKSKRKGKVNIPALANYGLERGTLKVSSCPEGPVVPWRFRRTLEVLSCPQGFVVP